MIHFDFVVSDHEGQMIFDGINSLIKEALIIQRKNIDNKELCSYMDQRIFHLELLKNKMLNHQED